jgi:hypothetical protein
LAAGARDSLREIKRGQVTAHKDKYAAGEQGLGYIYQIRFALACWRRSNIDHLCRLNFDQGVQLAS